MLLTLFAEENAISRLEIGGDTPLPRIGHSMSLMGGNLYLYGGSSDGTEANICADIYVLKNVKSFEGHASMIGVQLKDWLNVHKNRNFNDLCFIVGERKIMCSKAIIAARSRKLAEYRTLPLSCIPFFVLYCLF